METKQVVLLDTNHNIQIWQRIESQNMANSGWNYTSDSSFITISVLG